MIKSKKKLKTLKEDQDGMAVVEFALIAPVFLFMMMGSFDIGYSIYMKSVLDGAVQKAARDSALESAAGTGTAGIDTSVENIIKDIAPKATFDFDRKSYFTFNDVKRAEVFSDGNGDGICNNNEAFEDENDNDSWDADVGEDGIGGAKDIVLYTVSVSYPSLFSMGSFTRHAKNDEAAYSFQGWDGTRTLTSTTVLKNQPYATQGTATSVTRVCD